MADENDDYESDIDSGSESDSDNSMNMKKEIPKKIKIIKKENDDDDDEGSLVGREEDDEDDDGSFVDEEFEEDEDAADFEDDEKDNIRTIPQNFPDLDEEFEEDEEEDDDENYLQKFGEGIQKTIIQDHHPELQSHNNDEIEVLSIVTRDANGFVIDPFHRTIPIVSRYEKARVLGERAKQLNAGAEPFIEVDETVIDGYMIALKEFEEKKIPFIIQRPLPNGACEYWKLRDLEIV
jgi:DNA-directed RNA polymerase subunit K/omega